MIDSWKKMFKKDDTLDRIADSMLLSAEKYKVLAHRIDDIILDIMVLRITHAAQSLMWCVESGTMEDYDKWAEEFRTAVEEYRTKKGEVRQDGEKD